MTQVRTITSHRDGIYGGANAYANAYGSAADGHGTVAGGSGTGGTAVADVYITNTGAISVKGHGEGIDGYSYAGAHARGYTATGGTAIATTTIINAVTGTIANYRGDGIDGSAIANANAYGIGTFDKLSSGTGGTASATVAITNHANIGATYGFGGPFKPPFPNDNGTGIAGMSYASANAGYFFGPVGNYFGPFNLNNKPAGFGGAPIANTATGGTAVAITTINNTGQIHAYLGTSGASGDGIDGWSFANAMAISAGSYISGTRGPGFDLHGTAIGGTANASVTIDNSGAGITAHGGNGIDGYAWADTNAYGFSATGGTSSATTLIINSAPIQSDDGIRGGARADASGYGSPYADPGVGKGGTAVASVTINNTGPINSTFGMGRDGIYGSSTATANGGGNPYFNHFFLPPPSRQAFGGTAIASTTITNNQTIVAGWHGIHGEASAYASGYGVYGIKGTATGGTARATVSITNSGDIYSWNDGITASTNVTAVGQLFTYANSFLGVYYAGPAAGGIGGTAIANTNVTNSGNIFTSGSHAPGINAESNANAYGGGAGGTAIASTYILNEAGVIIKTQGHKSPGIKARSTAEADGGLVGGTASATTTVTSLGSLIVTQDWKIGRHRRRFESQRRRQQCWRHRGDCGCGNLCQKLERNLYERRPFERREGQVVRQCRGVQWKCLGND